MSHFAQLDENDVVIQVLRITQNILDSGLFGNPTSFIQTSYNTHGGVHLLGGAPLRKNFAGIGSKYDRILDAFIPQKPFTSWVLDKETCLWKPPFSPPDDGKQYGWDESVVNWVEVQIEQP